MVFSVSKDAEIFRLLDTFNLNEATFIYNGQIIIDTNTFDYYNMKDNDCVVLFPGKTVDISQMQNWIHITNDKEGFKEIINWAVNCDTAKELARIHDIKANKAEQRIKNIKKQIRANIMDKCINTHIEESILTFDEHDGPSIEALPVIW